MIEFYLKSRLQIARKGRLKPYQKARSVALVREIVSDVALRPVDEILDVRGQEMIISEVLIVEVRDLQLHPAGDFRLHAGLKLECYKEHRHPADAIRRHSRSRQLRVERRCTSGHWNTLEGMASASLTTETCER